MAWSSQKIIQSIQDIRNNIVNKLSDTSGQWSRGLESSRPATAQSRFPSKLPEPG
jgi:hypothetical protein